MMKFLILFSPRFAEIIVYMLQSTEYQPRAYFRWFWDTSDFSKVMKRRTLDLTSAARVLLFCIRCGMLLQISVALYLFYVWIAWQTPGSWQIGVALLLSYPIVWAHAVLVPLIIGRKLIIVPRQRRMVKASRSIFASHPAEKIAVAGSYGKTTMKELLGTVLSEGKKVAITPANKNVAVSHAAFAATLAGNEEVLVIEYGEGAPGDVAQFAQTTQPSIGVITGLAPAHLDQYPTLAEAGRDIFSLGEYLDNKPLFVNAESAATEGFIKKSYITYSESGADGWTTSEIMTGFKGVSFTLKKGNEVLRLKSGLLGRHQVGPLTAVVAIAKRLGMTNEQITNGIAKTQAFEHRMQPRRIRGAWIIDDTYNGNIDGVKAGLQLLQDLPATRRIYVTPGLVDQGSETQRVHEQLGGLISDARPDVVYLMENSVTNIIRAAMEAAGFNGELHTINEPLDFYTNIEHFLASGDVVLMQNDWTDNYY